MSKNEKKASDHRLLNAKVYRLENKHKEAAINYKKAVEIYPSYETLFEAGNYFYFINKYNIAENYYRKCLPLCNDNKDKATNSQQFG